MILYNIKISPNAIVTVGSILTKDVPAGTIMEASKVIGSFDELKVAKEVMKDFSTNCSDMKTIINFYWK